jgi:hypothetical protein
LVPFVAVASNDLINILLKKPEGLHHEKKVQDPYNSKPEGFDLKNNCLSRNSNLTRITLEPLFSLMHTL